MSEGDGRKCALALFTASAFGGGVRIELCDDHVMIVEIINT